MKSEEKRESNGVQKDESDKCFKGTTKTIDGVGPIIKTGNVKEVDGNLYFEVIYDDKPKWLPRDSNLVKGPVRGCRIGWGDFLGLDDFDQYMKGSSDDEKAWEWVSYCVNRGLLD